MLIIIFASLSESHLNQAIPLVWLFITKLSM